MELLSVQVGTPRTVKWQGKNVSTAIFKKKISGPVKMGKLNIEGDIQADLKYHGGEDKAVYAYSHDAYPWWCKKLDVASLPPGAFGENLTFDALDEKELCVGDRLSLGKCELQVVQPRFPCFKLGILFKDISILKTFMQSGRPGIYFRVLKEGQIQEGQKLEILERDPNQVSISEFFLLKQKGYKDMSLLKRLLKVENLNEEWRETFTSAIAKLEAQ